MEMEERSLRDAVKMYDDQFHENMKIAKSLLKRLRDKKEIQLAIKWLIRVNGIKSSSLDVKRSRNAFLYYLLKVLRETVLKHHLEDKSSTPYNSDNALGMFNSSNERSKICSKVCDKSQSTAQTSNVEYYSKWSQNHRTYVAVRPLPKRGALIYMAVSVKPGLKNWDLGNLKK